MSRLSVFAVVLTITASIIACTSTKKTAELSYEEQVVANIKKKYSTEQIEEGRVIYTGSCNKCHTLKGKSPEDYTIKEWERILPNMYIRSKLEETQSRKVSAYILTNAKM